MIFGDGARHNLAVEATTTCPSPMAPHKLYVNNLGGRRPEPGDRTGPAGMPVDELSADLMFGGQPADRCSSHQRMQRQVLPALRPHRHRRRENRGFGLRKEAGDAKVRTHVCFLHETG
jgi:hypothetical protein